MFSSKETQNENQFFVMNSVTHYVIAIIHIWKLLSKNNRDVVVQTWEVFKILSAVFRLEEVLLLFIFSRWCNCPLHFKCFFVIAPQKIVWNPDLIVLILEVPSLTDKKTLIKSHFRFSSTVLAVPFLEMWGEPGNLVIMLLGSLP